MKHVSLENAAQSNLRDACAKHSASSGAQALVGSSNISPRSPVIFASCGRNGCQQPSVYASLSATAHQALGLSLLIYSGVLGQGCRQVCTQRFQWCMLAFINGCAIEKNRRDPVLLKK
jgi:hypothetical protein